VRDVRVDTAASCPSCKPFSLINSSWSCESCESCVGPGISLGQRVAWCVHSLDQARGGMPKGGTLPSAHCQTHTQKKTMTTMKSMTIYDDRGCLMSAWCMDNVRMMQSFFYRSSNYVTINAAPWFQALRKSLRCSASRSTVRCSSSEQTLRSSDPQDWRGRLWTLDGRMM